MVFRMGGKSVVGEGIGDDADDAEERDSVERARLILLTCLPWFMVTMG